MPYTLNMPSFNPDIPKTLNSLTFLREVERTEPKGSRNQRHRRVECICDCGKKTVTMLTDYRTGHTKSCGCLQLNHVKSMASVHGLSGIPEYKVWATMVQRCKNKNDSGYKNYGARGIKVCSRWENSFADFISDMGRRPSKRHSLDRINNEDGYCSENCRWATKLEQCNNTRRNKFIEVNGVRKTVSEWARETGIPRATIYARISYGWEPERIIRLYQF